MRSRPTGGSANNAGMNATQIIVLATPVFFALMALEYAWGRHTGRNTYRLHDTLSSLALGVLSQLSAVFMVGLTLGLYTLAWRHAALWRVNDFWLSLPGWGLALLFYDFCYYWLHRMGHEVALLWAAHVVHHQSQHYNLSTALRQTSSGPLLAWLFYLPMALAGVPPQQFAVVALIDLLYQFWIHTEHVPRLGWFDRVFASPSNHRVHHAVNDAYLDRNYGGILILWDRLFGTFREETEPCVYGTRSPLNSCNPLWANAEVYAGLLRSGAHTPRWGDRLRLWLKPPGWQPPGLGAVKPAFDPAAVPRFDPSLSGPQALFCGAQFLALLGASASFLWLAEGHVLAQLLPWAAALVLGWWCLGAALQGRLAWLEVGMLEAAALATLTGAEGLQGWHHLFKPLAMALAWVWVLRRAPPGQPERRLLLALGACLVGDVMLMLPGLFLPGLAAFLIGHLAYLARWRQDAPWLASRPALLGCAAAGALMLAVLWPHLDPVLRVAVPAYVVVIVLMAAQALGRATVQRTPAAWGVAAGSLCFMVSDSLLALNRFVSPLPQATLWVLGSYYLAQWLLVKNAAPATDRAG